MLNWISKKKSLFENFLQTEESTTKKFLLDYGSVCFMHPLWYVAHDWVKVTFIKENLSGNGNVFDQRRRSLAECCLNWISKNKRLIWLALDAYDIHGKLIACKVQPSHLSSKVDDIGVNSRNTAHRKRGNMTWLITEKCIFAVLMPPTFTAGLFPTEYLWWHPGELQFAGLGKYYFQN